MTVPPKVHTRATPIPQPGNDAALNLKTSHHVTGFPAASSGTGASAACELATATKIETTSVHSVAQSHPLRELSIMGGSPLVSFWMTLSDSLRGFHRCESGPANACPQGAGLRKGTCCSAIYRTMRRPFDARPVASDFHIHTVACSENISPRSRNVLAVASRPARLDTVDPQWQERWVRAKRDHSETDRHLRRR